MTDVDAVEIVFIPSKLCNLRCKYCYELPLLADKRRMSGEQLQAMFRNFAEHFTRKPTPTVIQFFWHGGEPLLLPPEYLWQAFELQRAAFEGSAVKVRNVVQTNLTVLDDERVRLLRDGFDNAGVSLDLFSKLRVNKLGVDQEHRALANLERARAAGLQLSGVTVLSRPNLGRIPEIYRFYRDRGMSFRLLPLHTGMYGQDLDFEPRPQEILQALCELVDLWLADAPPIRIAPITSVIERVLAAQRYRDTTHLIYDKDPEEKLITVDTDGSVYSYNDLFRVERCWGNVFERSYSELLASPVRHLAVAAARGRQADTCGACPFFGKECDGFQIAEGEADFADYDSAGRRICVVQRGLVEHVRQRLTEAGVIRGHERGFTDAFIASQQVVPAPGLPSYAY